MDKLAFNRIIVKQKTEARKNIALYEIELDKSPCKNSILEKISKNKKFIQHSVFNINTTNDALKLIHSQHQNDIKSCDLCALYKVALEEDIRPRFGNLISLLQQEVDAERNNVERKHLPSQNDLTRWALKAAVLEFYQKMNMPSDIVVVETQYDDRLVPRFAPDFDIIFGIWKEKLDTLKNRNDKYTVEPGELDKADLDLQDGMKSSAFEKQLDRFREEFMQKLKR